MVMRLARRFVRCPSAFSLLLLVLLCTASTVATPAAAQLAAPTLRLEVNPKNGTVDDAYNLTVTVEGSGGDGTPVLTGGEDFKLSLIGSDVEVVGGAHEQLYRMNFRYQLLPKKAGALITPGAELAVGSKRLSQSGILLNVETSRIPSGQKAEDVFVLQSLDRRELYVGEQALANLELYSTKDLYRPQFSDLTFDDFWAEALQAEEPFERTVEGTRYWVLRSRRAIYPLKDGALTLPMRTVKVGVITQRVVRYPALGGFFNLQTVERVPEDRLLRSNEIRLKVLPLPPPPRDYQDWGMVTPVVGATAFSGSLDRSAVRTGETATLTVQLLSTGNISGAREIPLSNNGDLRIYQDTPQVRLEERMGQIVSVRTFKLSLVPLVPGVQKVPAIVLDYFDPRSKSYRRAELKDLQLVATGNALIRDTTSASASSQSEQSASSSAPAEQQYPQEGLLHALLTWVSPGTFFMGLFGIGVLTALVALLVKPRSQQTAWIGTSDETLATFMELFTKKCGLPPNAGFETLRAGVRRAFIDETLSFELLEVVDKLDRARGKPHEGLIKQLEALIPILR